MTRSNRPASPRRIRGSKRTVALTLGLMLVSATAALAHDMFVKPTRYFAPENSEVRVRVLNGTFTKSENSIARNRLAARANDGLRNQFGKRRLNEVVSGQREELMAELTRELNDAVRDSLGIQVIDVRVKKIDLPPEVSDAVYNRMSAEREKLAREYRSHGKEEAEKIRADADRQVTIIEAEAYRDAELARGEGDAKASALYSAAYNKDREFYAFTRSLRSYEQSFSNPDDVLVLDAKSDFFRYLGDSSGSSREKPK